MHSTNNLDDGYLGSGQRLWKSINKYGKEKHSIEILEFLPNREALKKREAEIITEDMVNDPNCMNLAKGGQGGAYSKEACQKGGVNGGESYAKKMREDKEFNNTRRKLFSETIKNTWKTGKLKYFDWTGKTHSEESKKKIGTANSIKQKGSKNSQFGTMWITNGKKSKKIKKDEVIPSGWKRGRKILS